MSDNQHTPPDEAEYNDLAKQLAKAIVYPETDVRRIAIIAHLLREFAADIKNGAIYGGI